MHTPALGASSPVAPATCQTGRCGQPCDSCMACTNQHTDHSSGRQTHLAIVLLSFLSPWPQAQSWSPFTSCRVCGWKGIWGWGWEDDPPPCAFSCPSLAWLLLSSPVCHPVSGLSHVSCCHWLLLSFCACPSRPFLDILVTPLPSIPSVLSVSSLPLVHIVGTLSLSHLSAPACCLLSPHFLLSPHRVPLEMPGCPSSVPEDPR